MINKISYPADLPIVDRREEIINAIRNHQVVIVAGDTGSGKTTQLPKMCLEAGRGRQRMIGCTQPRRLAATAMAARVAEELEPCGHRHLVGYKIRFRNQTSKQTRIKFMTDGILLAETQRDRKLTAYDTLIIDEAHERSLNIDFLLGYLKQLAGSRDDLKIIITSATIDTEKFSAHFGQAPIIEVSGRTYPVELRYRPAGEESDDDGEQTLDTPTYVEQAVAAVEELLLQNSPGDILIFMPTERDIRETIELLEEKTGPAGRLLVLPLFGRLHGADQKKIFRPFKGRKIVVATNIAETSLTVPGIRYVIDTGLARVSSYNVRARTTSLPVTAVSRASCDQRLGRCGRTAPGICIRLYGEDNYLNRPPFTLPEIKRANLAEVILRMISFNLGDPATFPFVDPPAPNAIKDGYSLLAELGAIDRRRRLTDKGRLMSRLPLAPTIARMIIEARDHNALREVVIIAAGLTVQDPRLRPADKTASADEAHKKLSDPASDFLSLLKLWQTIHGMQEDQAGKSLSQSRLRKFCKQNFLSFQRLREWRDIHEQISTILAEEKGFSPNLRPASYEAVHRAILSGHLRNIGVKKTKNTYQSARGREMMIFPGSGQFDKAGQWIMAAELVETTRLYARTVADIKVEWIEAVAGELCRSNYSQPRWQKRRGTVVADEKITLFGLVLVARRTVNYAIINPTTRKEARQIFIQAALVEGELQGKYPFLAHNLRLVADLEDMENRLRQRGVVADEYTIHQFYDHRLDEDVFDQSSLNRFLKKKGGDGFLVMTRNDIMHQAPSSESLTAFPTTLRCNSVSLELFYSFEPGGDEDGVSVHIPANLLGHLKPAIFEWLVPGLLEEKIVQLLKGLPKAIRKKLVPVAQTAADLAGELEIYRGDLYKRLTQELLKSFGVMVDRSMWKPEALPDHLRMRYCLLDQQGKTMQATREFRELSPEAGRLPSTADLEQLRKKWERQDIAGWDFDGLPDIIPLKSENQRTSGFVYPGLSIDTDGRVALKLFPEQAAREAATAEGLLALYTKQFPKQYSVVRKECGLANNDWPLHQFIGGKQDVNRNILSFILKNIFALDAGLLPGRAEFDSRVNEVKARGLITMATEIMDEIRSALQERRLTMEDIDRLERKPLTGRPAWAVEKTAAKRPGGYDTFRLQMDEIMPPTFLTTFSRQRLQAIPRYCRGLRIRVERAHASMEKDAAKAELLRPHYEKLRQWRAPEPMGRECVRLVEEYEMMLEEFKISLFAQEIKTAYPVSAKRLEKKWQYLLENC